MAIWMDEVDASFSCILAPSAKNYVILYTLWIFERMRCNKLPKQKLILLETGILKSYVTFGKPNLP